MGDGKPYIEPGYYEHYKGGIYQVHGLAWIHDQNPGDGEGDWYVMYQGDKAKSLGAMELRTVSDFCEHIKWPNGETNPRFLLASPGITFATLTVG